MKHTLHMPTLGRNNLGRRGNKIVKLYVQLWGPFLGPLLSPASCGILSPALGVEQLSAVWGKQKVSSGAGLLGPSFFGLFVFSERYQTVKEGSEKNNCVVLKPVRRTPSLSLTFVFAFSYIGLSSLFSLSLRYIQKRTTEGLDYLFFVLFCFCFSISVFVILLRYD